jgi:hypothetical protein
MQSAMRAMEIMKKMEILATYYVFYERKVTRDLVPEAS